MLMRTAPAVPGIRQARARALCVAGGALAAALAWTVEVPLLGIDLNFRYGTSHTRIVAAGQVIGASLAALLLGWLLLAVLEQRTLYARTLWTSLALAGLAASVALPLTVATTAATTPLGRRRACRDAPDDRGRRDPRHGAHSAGAPTAHQEASRLTLNADEKSR